MRKCQKRRKRVAKGRKMTKKSGGSGKNDLWGLSMLDFSAFVMAAGARVRASFGGSDRPALTPLPPRTVHSCCLLLKKKVFCAKASIKAAQIGSFRRLFWLLLANWLRWSGTQDFLLNFYLVRFPEKLIRTSKSGL